MFKIIRFVTHQRITHLHTTNKDNKQTWALPCGCRENSKYRKTGARQEQTRKSATARFSTRTLSSLAVALCTERRVVRFGSKVGQIGPKWEKSGAFSDQISVHLARGRQMH